MGKEIKTIAWAVALAFIFVSPAAWAPIYMHIEGVAGDVQGPGGANDWFIADSFSFGVEREMKESGEKGGTEDINIGVGELQECTISKSMDSASPYLAQAAINGNSVGQCDICLVEGDPGSTIPICYAHYVMERCFVKSLATESESGDVPREEIAFYYNKIAFGHESPNNSMTWDQERNRPWSDGEGLLFNFDPSVP